MKDDFLVCAFKLMPGGVLHALRAIDRAPAPEGIKEIPGTAKACREVAERRWRIQEVQREVCRREPLLSQFAAKYVHRVVPTGSRLGKSDAWQEKGPSFPNIS